MPGELREQRQEHLEVERQRADHGHHRERSNTAAAAAPGQILVLLPDREGRRSAGVERRMGEYRAWQSDRAAAVSQARAATIVAHTATELARTRVVPERASDRRDRLAAAAGRPFGPRFGSSGACDDCHRRAGRGYRGRAHTARTHARVLLADEAEASAAAAAVTAALANPLFDEVRRAQASGACLRECPVLWRLPDGALLEGTVDVVYEQGDGLTILDFKTDREPSDLKDQYRAAVAALLPGVRGIARKAGARCAREDLRFRVIPACGKREAVKLHVASAWSIGNGCPAPGATAGPRLRRRGPELVGRRAGRAAAGRPSTDTGCRSRCRFRRRRADGRRSRCAASRRVERVRRLERPADHARSARRGPAPGDTPSGSARRSAVCASRWNAPQR